MIAQKQNPFSLYDFLGYFTPGAIFIYTYFTIAAHLDPSVELHEVISSRLGFHNAEIYIPFILFSYALGHLLSFLSAVTVEKFSLWSVGYPSKYLLGIMHEGYFSTVKNKRLRNVIRLLIGLFLLPISLLDICIGKYCKLREIYAQPLDELLQEAIKIKMVVLITERAKIEDPTKHGHAINNDFFRYAYHYAVEHAPNHLPKMQNYVALYGFLRVLTFLSVLLFWAMALHLTVAWPPNMQFIIWIFLTMALSYILYMAFQKFYRRFSLEALMAATVINT